MGCGGAAERIGGELLMTTYLTTDTDLTAVASAIRTKGGTSAALQWPSGFVSAVQAIPSGGGGGGVNTCTLTIGDDGEVTCSNFSDHEPTGEYVAVTVYNEFGYQNTTLKDVLLYFSGSPDSSHGKFIAVSDLASPNDWAGGVTNPFNTAMLYDYESVETGTGAEFAAGTYIATVIEV